MSVFPCTTLIIYLHEHERHLNMMNDLNQHPTEDKVPNAKCSHADVLSVSIGSHTRILLIIPCSQYDEYKC